MLDYSWGQYEHMRFTLERNNCTLLLIIITKGSQKAEQNLIYVYSLGLALDILISEEFGQRP